MTKKELIEELSKYRFDKTNVELAIRADFKCEYCEKDLLANMDNYKLWQVDHIIPKSSNYNDFDYENFNNKAISCTQCNKDLKNKWNPLSEGLDDKTREQFILLTKKYIKEKRKIKNSEIDEIRKIVNDFKNN
tara:strand:+ start:2087 stop:2485 length:399 start_codon:yes stop_codon:yes gene_type:complete